jgi:ActR/RegA family two-component response regulator
MLLTFFTVIAVDLVAVSLLTHKSDYLAKPVNTEQLLTIVRLWLHR